VFLVITETNTETTIFCGSYELHKMATTIKIELDNKVKKDGTQTVMLRITQNRKLKRISLGISVLSQNFNPKGGLDRQNWIRANGRDGFSENEAKTFNGTIYKKIIEARQIKEELAENATRHTISKKLKQIDTGELAHSFLDFAKSHIERTRGSEYNTHRGLVSSFNKFTEYLKDSNCDDLLFGELDVDLVEEYKRWLKNVKGNNTNTVSKELSRLRAIINEAIRRDKMPFEKNPFLKIKLTSQPSKKVRLNEEEFGKLKCLELPENSLICRVRDAYLFSFYSAGIRISDLLGLQWKDVQDGRISYQVNKTEKIHSTKMPPQAIEILQRYKTPLSKPNHFVFPFLKNGFDLSDTVNLKKQISAKDALINKYLKIISEKAEIPPISFHTARHSFAFIGNRKSNNLYGISKALGHRNIKMTENYLSSFDTQVIDETTDEIYNNID
jgi:integrase